jgi:hypothetical protein
MHHIHLSVLGQCRHLVTVRILRLQAPPERIAISLFYQFCHQIQSIRVCPCITDLGEIITTLLRRYYYNLPVKM